MGRRSGRATSSPSSKRQFAIPGPADSFYEGLIGGGNCMRHPSSCDLSKGVVTNDADRTVTFNLTAPDPEFLDKLTLPFAFAVPKDTPLKDLGNSPPPGTGDPVEVRRPATGCGARAKPVLQGLELPDSAGRPAESDRLHVQPAGRAGGDGGRAGSGRLDVRLSAGRSAQRDEHTVSESGARRFRWRPRSTLR